MQNLGLSEEELRAVTRRAEEIAAASASAGSLEASYDSCLRAMVEMGVPQEAALQALREHLNLHAADVEPGQRVFAPAADGFLYPATVESVQGGTAQVRFAAGGHAECQARDLHPFSLTPGTIVSACWKGDDSWYAARVRTWDAEKERVKVVYRLDGAVETVPLTRLRLAPPERTKRAHALQWASSPGLDLLLKLTAGGVLGFLLGRLFGG